MTRGLDRVNYFSLTSPPCVSKAERDDVPNNNRSTRRISHAMTETHSATAGAHPGTYFTPAAMPPLPFPNLLVSPDTAQQDPYNVAMASHQPKLFRQKPLHTRKERKNMKVATSLKNTNHIFAHSQTNYHPTGDQSLPADYFSSPMVPNNGNAHHDQGREEYSDDITSSPATNVNPVVVPSPSDHGYNGERSMQPQSQTQSQPQSQVQSQVQSQSQPQSQSQSQSQTQLQAQPQAQPQAQSQAQNHSQQTQQPCEDDWAYPRCIYYQNASTESYHGQPRVAEIDRNTQEGNLSPPLGQYAKQAHRDGHNIQEVQQLTDHCVLLTPDSRVSSPNQFIRPESTHSKTDEGQPHQMPQPPQAHQPYESSDQFRIESNKFPDDQEYDFDFTAYGLSASQADSFKDIFERQLETLYKSVSDEFNSGIYKDDGKKMGIEFVLSYMQQMFCDSESEESTGSMSSYTVDHP